MGGGGRRYRCVRQLVRINAQGLRRRPRRREHLPADMAPAVRNHLLRACYWFMIARRGAVRPRRDPSSRVLLGPAPGLIWDRFRRPQPRQLPDFALHQLFWAHTLWLALISPEHWLAMAGS